MSTSFSLSIYRCITYDSFRHAADAVMGEIDGAIEWGTPPKSHNDELQVATNGVDTTVCKPHFGGNDHLLWSEVGRRLDAVRMDLRFQNSALWEYSLYRGGTHIHDFCTLPRYWKLSRRECGARRGNVDELCTLWGCEKSKVANYLVDWKFSLPWYSHLLSWVKGFYQPPIIIDCDHWYYRLFMEYYTKRKGKAYPDDECEYGDFCQGYDFLRALRAPHPLEDAKDGQRNRIELPEAKKIVAVLTKSL